MNNHQKLTRTSKFAVINSPLNGNYSAFSEIFSADAHQVASLASLNERNRTDNNLMYGEIVDLESLKEMFNIIKVEYGGLQDADIAKFYDLGSGAGRPVFAAASLHPFASCTGIEIISSLHNLAVEYSSRLSNELAAPTHFVCGSFLDLDTCDWTDGDIVFANSTCYDQTLINEISSLATNMRTGAFFITLSRPLTVSSGFVVVEERRYDMSWGMADYFLHIKRS